MELSFWEIAKVVSASNDYQQWEDFALSGIEFDSRKIEVGNLFVPLPGVRDGHQFAKSAKEKGAAATFWAKTQKERPDFPYLEVEDPTVAFQQLAAYYRQKLNPMVVAITGSNGKTTTKDMCAAVLEQKYKTFKTQGNYNNEYGLPYTILHMPTDTEALVLEMGMDGADQISLLTKIAQPDFAAITMIGESHIENLGSREGIAKAKWEIVQGLKEDGTIVLPFDEPLLRSLAQNISQSVLYFGLTKEADIWGEVVAVSQKETTFLSNLGSTEITLPIIGDYNVKNALIALAIGQLCEVPFSFMVQGLEHFKATKNRAEWLEGKNGLEILSDVYNANPTAMKVIIDNFSQLETPKRKVLVLGDMLELGEDARLLHASVGEHIFPEQIDAVYLYGDLIQDLQTALEKKASSWVHYYPLDQKEKLVTDLQKYCDSQTMMLLKASNGTNLLSVVEKLQDER
ncbi:UDP-N-acetylmuramoyl-tripeptide--D-alanyl-D-alanine ligase [Catellicoccus marimammalium]|uniref:UDP-N-acetylmuramoyl-tripeptide--D-alanyl-D-alanine ligase n=1 Tax=Catellicoccus marimammalium M35/04/3 TaxID=1234409 RepID=K8ZLW9_9ENTE|nr:UDP-N-acetylmuramoyl-tripeptide--D-alanyl-D-alanine ligase [Catellicoccus marimammalium]EKU27523.1 UDP-N-acetylmuramoylalanyl-D-glutamyl-2,6- diaminopimelate--D-alanyl-D-alanine ligase [Catellicoccus marimammalium M35/04/3]